MYALALFALPMIIGNLFQQTYTMVDSAIVGRYVSEQALAAVGASYSLTNVFICVAIGGGMGASVVVSRHFGAKAYDRMKTAVYTALLTFLGISILLGSVGLLCGKWIMNLLQTPVDVLDLSVVYLNIYFLGLPFLFMYNVLSAMFNALGKSRIPLYFLIFSSIFNVGLDIFMVQSLQMGVAGVAWATLIAQGISAVLSFCVLLRTLQGMKDDCAVADNHVAESDFLECDAASEKLSGETQEIESGNLLTEAEKRRSREHIFSVTELRTMAGIALPSILQQSTVSIGMMLVQSVVNSFGSQMLAGYSAAMRVESICIVPMSAMGNAISSYTAQNIGAGQKDRVRTGYRAVTIMVLGFAAVICLALELSGDRLAWLFLGADGTPATMQTAVDCMMFMGWFYCLIGFKMTADGVLRGAGDMKLFTVANLVNLGIRVLVAVTMAPRFGIFMVWAAVPVGWTANWLISYCRYRTGKWEKR